jgi:hypothetical protein
MQLMKSVNELLQLFMRQAELENAMKRPGGARVIDEQELHDVRRRIAVFPETARVVGRAAQEALCSVEELRAGDGDSNAGGVPGAYPRSHHGV